MAGGRYTVLTRDDLQAVVELARPFDEPGFSPGGWTESLAPGDGKLVVTGGWMPSDEVVEWQDALSKRGVIVEGFDWMAPEWSERMAEFQTEPALLVMEDLETVRKVLTTCVRADRFVEGFLADMFSSGVVHAAMRRLARLAETA